MGRLTGCIGEEPDSDSDHDGDDDDGDEGVGRDAVADDEQADDAENNDVFEESLRAILSESDADADAVRTGGKR